MDVPEAVAAADVDVDELEAPTDVDVDGDRPDVDDDLPDGQDDDGLLAWAHRRPSGSYRDFNLRDLWDPEGGGERRVAFHLSDLAGPDLDDGLPNGVGVALGLVEMWYVRASRRDDDGGSDDGGGGDVDDDGGGAARMTAEGDGYPSIGGTSA